jgi:hypothetical protein
LIETGSYRRLFQLIQVNGNCQLARQIEKMAF